MDSVFFLGKLPVEELGRLLALHAPSDPRVIVGPGVGLDSAVLDVGDRYLVAKTDPITFAADRIGWYAVHVNANDVACSGAAPRWFMATVLLPEGRADAALVEDIFEQIAEACAAVGAGLVGGHTEITFGIDRPLVVGCMLGEVEKESLVTSAGAQVGDVVMLTGGIPIETTAILAREKAEELVGRFSPEFLARSREALFDPGISVVPAAKAAMGVGGIHAMHDPTEGGLVMGLWEIAKASGCSLVFDPQAVPLLPEGRALCEAFGLDPLASIASGALLLTTAAANRERLQAAFDAQGIRAATIGRVEAQGERRVYAQTAAGRSPLPRPARDELAKLFA